MPAPVHDSSLITAAASVMRAAAQQGIQVCFANPGTTEMWLVEALDHTAIRGVLCLHENVATGAADGWARMRGSPALTLLHLGAGLSNGLANLHNARRAGTPVINLVGEMSSSVKPQDPLLNSDIGLLASSVSQEVRCVTSAETAADDLAACMRAVETAQDAGGSRVATLVIPHDISWTLISPALCKSLRPRAVPDMGTLPSSVTSFLDSCAAAVQRSGRKCAFLLGRRALLQQGGALDAAGRIAAVTGATLMAENAFARVDRGLGCPKLKRLAYFPDAAARELAPFNTLVVVDTRVPVPMFGYKDGRTCITCQGDDNIWELDLPEYPPDVLLKYLAKKLQADAVRPGLNCQGVFVTKEIRPAKPTVLMAEGGSITDQFDSRQVVSQNHMERQSVHLGAGALTGPSMCTVVARLQPDNCIVVDESITSGSSYWDVAASCPPFSHLTLTGGAIGCGPCLALGAALACPGQTVINLQADGSAMYSLPALWSQAREGARVITIICANAAYQILKVEQSKQQIPSTGVNSRALTDISSPTIDWVALAKGMGVDGVACSTVDEFEAALRVVLTHEGPYLIQANLA